MFNISQYRLSKKLYATKKLLNGSNIKRSDAILLKTNRSLFISQLILSKKIRVLMPGLKNVCSITGKYKSTFNALRVSRHVYRDFGGTSILPNYSKLS